MRTMNVAHEANHGGGGQRFTGIELNPAFAALAAERLQHAAPATQGGTGNGSEDTSR